MGAEPGRAHMVYPSRHRICAYPVGDGKWDWSIMPPSPDNRVLAVSASSYSNADNALQAGKRWFAKRRVDLLLAERKVDFSQTPCTTPSSSTPPGPSSTRS